MINSRSLDGIINNRSLQMLMLILSFFFLRFVLSVRLSEYLPISLSSVLKQHVVTTEHMIIVLVCIKDNGQRAVINFLPKTYLGKKKPQNLPKSFDCIIR